jgi:hypothetical protein
MIVKIKSNSQQAKQNNKRNESVVIYNINKEKERINNTNLFYVDVTIQKVLREKRRAKRLSTLLSFWRFEDAFDIDFIVEYTCDMLVCHNWRVSISRGRARCFGSANDGPGGRRLWLRSDKSSWHNSACILSCNL